MGHRVTLGCENLAGKDPMHAGFQGRLFVDLNLAAQNRWKENKKCR
jgi:hypothetical protein